MKEQSIEFTKKNQSVTYLVFSNEDASLVGYFTITIKPITVNAENFSNTMKRKIARVSELDEENGTYTVQISAKDSADDSMYGDKASMIINKDADNGKVISFTVDDIAPEIAISGVKDGENYDNATDIKLDYSDANKIDSITVQRVSDTGDIIDSYEVSNEDIETAGEKIGRITYTAQEYNDWQTVKFAVTDIAGNTANAEVRILVTSNGWIKFVNNRPLFIGSIVGLVVLLGVIVFVIIYNKKKKTTK